MLGSSLFIVMLIVFTINIAVVGFMARSSKFQNCLFSTVTLILTTSSIDLRTLTAESNLSHLSTTDFQPCFQPHISSDTLSTINPFENIIYFIIENNKAQEQSREHILLLLISGIAFI
jgi:hypothetical protein